MVLPWWTQNFEIEKFRSEQAKPYIPLTYIWFFLGRPKIFKIESFGSAKARPLIPMRPCSHPPRAPMGIVAWFPMGIVADAIDEMSRNI